MKIIFSLLILLQIVLLVHCDHKENNARDSDEAQMYAFITVGLVLFMLVTVVAAITWFVMR